MNKNGNILIVTSSPHLHSPDSVPTAMRDVIIALLPALLFSVYFFRMPAAMVIISCVTATVVTEILSQKFMGKENTVKDYSAVVTGLLLAFTLPPTLPPWIAAIGGVVSILIGKQFFGGLGHNVFNPALIGRGFLLASWPVAMTTWNTPIDIITTATPLGIIKEGAEVQLPSLWNLFIGNVSGSLGETSALALLIGGLYLLYKGHIDWRIPVSFLGTVFVATLAAGLIKGEVITYAVIHLFAGGLFLGAFFMATDWVTSPVTKRGRLIFGLGCGFLTALIRLKGGYPEGVCYAILLMNAVTPLIDRYCKDRVFGRVKAHA